MKYHNIFKFLLLDLVSESVLFYEVTHIEKCESIVRLGCIEEECVGSLNNKGE